MLDGNDQFLPTNALAHQYEGLFQSTQPMPHMMYLQRELVSVLLQ